MHLQAYRIWLCFAHKSVALVFTILWTGIRFIAIEIGTSGYQKGRSLGSMRAASGPSYPPVHRSYPAAWYPNALIQHHADLNQPLNYAVLSHEDLGLASSLRA
jgi:hypothetical protein